jgi:hypothetical protein
MDVEQGLNRVLTSWMARMTSWMAEGKERPASTNLSVTRRSDDSSCARPAKLPASSFSWSAVEPTGQRKDVLPSLSEQARTPTSGFEFVDVEVLGGTMRMRPL